MVHDRGFEASLQMRTGTGKKHTETDIPCKSCSNNLVRLKWNRSGDILICINVECKIYHRPQGSIRNEQSLQEVKAGFNEEVYEPLKKGPPETSDSRRDRGSRKYNKRIR